MRLFTTLYVAFSVAGSLAAHATEADRVADIQYLLRQSTDRQSALLDQLGRIDRSRVTVQQWNALQANSAIAAKQVTFVQGLLDRKLTENDRLYPEFRRIARELDDDALAVERYRRIDLERARQAQEQDKPMVPLPDAEVRARAAANLRGQELQQQKSLLFSLLADPRFAISAEARAAGEAPAPAPAVPASSGARH